ncbi:menaquinone-dependent protoporphyrinogen oxidase [Anaerosphaera aminiphila DSM 21120]|uniref:Menaquinone-dependent protoporphyrinogen oxidase n=1 Tax=Anaerosphaera aminiphila DSM 21120 TaxID=1120995 RepID=A0A1M5PG62_9FIRM|nr:flavodoxin domain-containing protein [Anaerosphaera aminiphila]SHH00711.1 menaquinone-dependent protoporphyrinogen oxidase [Anaerosphaera aminiphila DSM 21120]
MKVLVLYESKYGCTKDCVEYLKNKLNCTVKDVDIKNEKVPELQEYNLILIGSPIYMGKIQRDIKNFCDKRLEELLKKKIILFISCTTPNQVDDFFKNNFPVELLKNSLGQFNFGGELNMEKMSFIDKKITQLAEKLEPREIRILYENIEEMANYINADFKL